MSYDLFFRWRRPPAAGTPDGFLPYFMERPHYRCTDNQAWYEHEKTGVYFSFDIGAPEADGERDPTLAPVAFNLNYLRPHPFGLEAEPELTAFVRRFDLLVSDPQTDGMGDGEYSPEGFLRGWNHGNEFGYKSMLPQSPDAARYAMPAATIASAWRWNRAVLARQEAIGEAAYVARVFFFDVDGVLRVGAVWGDAIPTLLPRVEVVMMPRKDLAPRRLFRKNEDFVLVTWEELEPLLARFPLDADGALPARRLFYDEPPAFLVDLIRAKPPHTGPFANVEFDKILDRELVNRVR
ncbi:MAG TPA: hypothetical protein VGT02_02070 [Methylomirabilota bacterium]|nr:hypothetical protein [Methylomirabilota bacterium]